MSAGIRIPLWRRIRGRLTYRRIHLPPRACPVCGLDVWFSTRRNRSKTGRVYCCATHKDYAARPRPKPRARLGAHTTAAAPPTPSRCPRPDKVRFVDEEDARTRFHAILSADGQMEPYVCPAGDHWHVGHPHVDDGQRVQSIARVTTGHRPRLTCPACTKDTAVTANGNVHSHRRGDGLGGRCPMSGRPAAEVTAAS